MSDHDRLFKELITTFFVEFIDLFLPEVAAYLEPASLVALDKEIFTDVTEGQRYETDVLMRASFKDQNAYFLIHLEHQSYAETNFGRRMFNYFARLYEEHNLEVYPIVLFSYDEPLRQEPHIHEIIFPNKKVLKFDYDVIQLNRLDWHDFLNRPNPVASALMAKMKIAIEDRVQVKIECLRMLVGLGLDPARTHLISGFVDTYLKLNQAEEQKFQTDLANIIPEQKEEVMEIITSWKREGIEEGKREGELNIILQLLGYRLGTLAPELEAWVKELPSPKLEELGKALFDFTKVEDLVGWLDSH